MSVNETDIIGMSPLDILTELAIWSEGKQLLLVRASAEKFENPLKEIAKNNGGLGSEYFVKFLTDIRKLLKTEYLVGMFKDSVSIIYSGFGDDAFVEKIMHRIFE